MGLGRAPQFIKPALLFIPVLPKLETCQSSPSSVTPSCGWIGFGEKRREK